MKIILLSATCAGLFGAVSGVVQAAAISGQGTWETTLQGRDLDGNLATAEAYYDTILDITWLADANYAGTKMYRWVANTWVSNLNPYGSGIMGWRLPDADPINGAYHTYSFSYNGSTDWGYNISAPGTIYDGSTANEMAHMFYNTLGNTSSCAISSSVMACINQSGGGLSNGGPFGNIQTGAYWSSTTYGPDASNAYVFSVSEGVQWDDVETTQFSTWAVHEGDVGVEVSSVPIPAAAWLFGSGLLGLIGLGRKHRRC